ncbi:AAA family ATPase [Oxalobacteraceae bacterium]|nr:AAA family ATPase [Oxalobacteraceae bacterium]
MIIAIANQCGGSGKTIVANNLALLRARSGRKVMLVDTDPKKSSCAWNSARIAAGVQPRVAARAIVGGDLAHELELLRLHYNDILIDTEGRDTPASRAALISARLVLVPVSPGQVDLAKQYQLIARLNSARMFNPGLRVLFVMVGTGGDPDPEQMAAVRAYVTRVMAATLATTVIHEQGAAHLACGPGRCVCDLPGCDQGAAAEMGALYREVFAN